MHRYIIGLTICVALVCGIAGTSTAGPKVAVYVLPYDSHIGCGTFPEIETCTDIVTTCDECDAVVAFPVFYDLEEYQGLYYGLTWPGPYAGSFVSCSDLVAGVIRRPGETIAQRWVNCHDESTVIPGYLVIYPTEAGQVCVLPHGAVGRIGVVNCWDRVYGVSFAACAGVCGMDGEHPCQGCARHMSLELHTTPGGGCVIAGHLLTYTLVYHNTSNDFTANNVTLRVVLPPKSEFSTASQGWRYSASSHAVDWKVASIEPGRLDSVYVTVKVDWESPPGTEVVSRGRMFCEESALAVRDTVLVCEDTYTPLTLEKHDDVGASGFRAGDTLSYDIAFGNTVNDIDVHNVMLVDRLPKGVTFLSASEGGLYEEANRRVRWELGTLPAGETGAVSLVVNTGSHWAEGSKIKNKVEIVCDETRPSLAEAVTEVSRGWLTRAAIHVEPCKGAQLCTGSIPGLKTCQDIKTFTAGCGCLRIFPVFIDIPEYTGLNYSLYWPERWGEMAFVSCSDVTVGDIVRPGDAIHHSWTRCRSNTFAIPGFGEIFAPDSGYMWIDKHPDYGMICGEDCDGDLIWIPEFYPTGVCGAPPDPYWQLPCANVPNEHTFYKTWGAIKAMFR